MPAPQRTAGAASSSGRSLQASSDCSATVVRAYGSGACEPPQLRRSGAIVRARSPSARASGRQISPLAAVEMQTEGGGSRSVLPEAQRHWPGPAQSLKARSPRGMAIARGACRPGKAAARLTAPGTTTRAPCSAPRTARSAISSGVSQRKSGVRSSAPAKPAMPTNSVLTGPWADRRQRHAGTLQLVVDRLAQVQQEGLGRGRRWHSREAAGRRLLEVDVDDGAAAALDHRRQVASLQIEGRLHVQPGHFQQPLAIGSGKVVEVAKTRVVDQDLDVQAQFFNAADQLVSRRRVSEVAGNRLGSDPPARGELRGELAKSLFAARHQRDAVALRGQVARDRNSDAGGSARDDSGRVRVRRRQGQGADGTDIAPSL